MVILAMSYKSVNLGDTNLFEFVKEKTGWPEKKWRELNTENISDFPVFTASQNPVAFVKDKEDKIIQASESDPLISFASNGDGSAGRNFVIHKCPFYVSNDRTVLKIKDPNLLIEYVEYKLRTMKSVYGFCFAYKATPNNLKEVSLEIPVSSAGRFDVNTQLNVAKKYQNIKASQRKALSFSQFLKNSNVPIDGMLENKTLISVSLSNENLFEVEIGKRILKKNVLTTGIPAFSANVISPFGFVEKSNLNNFAKPSLIWGIDGIFDWNYIPKNKVFATTDHCGRLTVQSENLYPKYIYYALKNTKNFYGFDRTYRASLRNLRQAVTVDIPITENGDFDIATQKEISRRYEKLESAKAEICDKLEALSLFQISLD